MQNTSTETSFSFSVLLINLDTLMFILVIHIVATVHHCVFFALQAVPFLCSNFPVVMARPNDIMEMARAEEEQTYFLQLFCSDKVIKQ